MSLRLQDSELYERTCTLVYGMLERNMTPDELYLHTITIIEIVNPDFWKQHWKKDNEIT